jgi:uncharacterized iron-regulated membrane protein
VRLRWLVMFHRWAGVVLCLFFCMWFVTGAVLHFVPFPSLSAEQRLARSRPIDLEAVQVSPSAALRSTSTSIDFRLTSVLGRPVYVFRTAERRVSTVAADTGLPLSPISASEAEAIAGAFLGRVAESVDGPFEYDQWIVAEEFDAWRPFLRVRFNDEAGSVVYVSEKSGEVVQQTTSHERMWNCMGAILHWIYFEPLRSHGSIWDRSVWWLSLVALCSTLAGACLGIVRWLANRRAHRRGVTPFRGWMGWHHRIGLVAGLVVLTWILSGWLSMDHGLLISRGEPTQAMAASVRGLSWSGIAAAASMDAVRDVGSAAEVEFSAIAGQPFMVVRGPPGSGSRIIWLDGSGRAPGAGIPADLLMAGARALWPGDVVTDRGAVTASDMYALAESMPAGTRMFRAERPLAVDSYIDPVSGQLQVVMDAGRRGYAWTYYGLHTLKFPGLASHPAIRRVLVLALLTLGFAFNITATVIGISRLRATLPTRVRS